MGQVAGDLDTKIQTINFNQELTNVSLDPDPKIGIKNRQTITEHFGNLGQPSSLGLDIGADIVRQMLSKIDINAPSWVFDVVNGFGEFSFVTIRPTLKAGLNLDYGGYIELNDVGKANLKVDYPVEITITYPEPNTFGCGDQFTIQTSYIVNQKENMLQVTPPFYEMEVGPILENLKFQVGAGLYVKACFGVPVLGECVGVPETWDLGEFYIINESIPLPSILDPLPPLVIACENAFGPNKIEVDLIACTTGPSSILGIMHEIKEGYNRSNPPPKIPGFATITSDLISVGTPELPFGAPPMPEFHASFKKIASSDLKYIPSIDGKKLKVNGESTDFSSADFDLISLLEFGGIITSISLGDGIGSVDFGDISPAFSIDQKMNFEFEPRIHISVELETAMAYEVHDDVDGLVSYGKGKIVNLIAGQKIVATYPQELSLPTKAESFSTMDGDFTTLTTQEYFNSTKINLMELQIGSFQKTIFSEETDRESTGDPIKIQDHTFNLEGFDRIKLDDLLLDPENPIITISSLTIEDVINLGKGTRAVAYKVGIRNDGDVNLNDVEVFLPLAESYKNASNFKVTCNESSNLNVDETYDAFTNANLLSPGNSLEPGEEQFINVLIEVNPEISEILADDCFGTVDYYATATANGVSPIGTQVTNNYNHCTSETRGEVIASQIDLGASIINSIEDFTIYASKSLTFSKQQTLSKGNIGSAKDVVFENVSSKGSGMAEIIGDLHAQENIDMQGQSDVEVDYAQIGRELRTLGNSTSLTTTGTMKHKSNCVAIYNIPQRSLGRFSGKTKVYVAPNEIRNLSPGYYSEVRLSSGSQLIMSPGTYQIKSWTFSGSNAKVSYNLIEDLSIEIYIDKWNVEKGDLTFEISGNGSSKNINYYLSKKGNTHFRNTKITGNIYAPEAGVVFDLNSTMNGSCYAESIIFRANSNFVGHDYLEPLNIPETCLESISIPLASKTQIDEQDIKSTVSGGPIEIVSQELPMSVYPNPFDDLINVNLFIEHSGMATIQIYDNRGKLIETLKDGYFSEGEYTFQFILDNLSSGLYFCKLTTAFGTKVQRILKK